MIFRNTEFGAMFAEYRSYYINKNGISKYNKVHDNIQKSNKVSMLDGVSIRMKQAPTAKDYLNTLNTIPYFMFSGNETCALGAIIAIKLWNERVNQTYCFATNAELSHKVESVFKFLKL